MSEFYFKPIFGWPVVLVVAIVLVGLLFVGPTKRRLRGGRRWVLVGLRLGVVALLVFAMLRPGREETELKKQSATLTLLADRSRSMQAPDAVGGKSRFDQEKDLLESSSPLLADLAKTIKVQVYAFDETAEKLELDSNGRVDLGPTPEGEQTALGAVLEDVLREQADQRIAAVILLSDGAQRAYAPRDVPSDSAARRMADLGVPLYTFVFGQARSPSDARDIKLDDLLAPARVFVKNRLDVAATLSITGYPRQDIAVRLLFETPEGKMESVAAETYRATVDDQKLTVELSHLPQAEGEYKLTLQADQRDGELVTTNNSLSTFVTVRGGGVNVLYLEGALRVESGFVRRALDASADIHVDYRWVQRPGDKFDLSGLLAPGKYDVVMLGDVDSSSLKSEDLQALAKLVDAGGGLIMLGGTHSFGPGGYAETPLADLLPVKMDRLERQPPGERVSPDLHVPEPLVMRPAEPLGVKSPIMQLAPPAENLATWRKLPPLSGANKFRGLKRTALCLAESDDEKRVPLLVAGQPGGGRVLAFAGDSTWRWRLAGFAEQQQRFWRQAILWLARTEETGEGVWIQLDQRRFGPRQRVRFTTGYHSKEGQPVTDAQLEAEIVLPDGKRQPVSLIQGESQTTGELGETTQPGDYTIVVRARRGGEIVAESKARFLVFPFDLELDNPAADPGLLASLSRLTEAAGGRAMAAEELNDLLEEILRNPPELEIARQTQREYYDEPAVFLLFVALIGAEWFLRKRWGLV